MAFGMITEKQCRDFEDVRKSGAYNMIMEAGEVRDLIGLTKTEYIELVSSYDDFRSMYDDS